MSNTAVYRQRRAALAPLILPIYAEGFGHKAIAKQLNLAPRIVRTILIEQGVYQPGKLFGGEGHRDRLRDAQNARIPAWKREQMRRDRLPKNITNRASDLPLFEHATKIRARMRARWTPEKQEQYMRRYYNDAQFRLANLLRKRVNKLVKKENKSAHTLDLLDCTLEHLHAHLESTFKEGMTWIEYGLWQIDHIRPCASFDLTTEEGQRACFHWSNLQALWKKDNASKGSLWNGKRHRLTSSSIANV